MEKEIEDKIVQAAFRLLEDNPQLAEDGRTYVTAEDLQRQCWAQSPWHIKCVLESHGWCGLKHEAKKEYDKEVDLPYGYVAPPAEKNPQAQAAQVASA
jgi:hypothetical protein